MLKELIKKNRSYRRFYKSEKMDRKILEDLIDHARLSPSAKNMQPLKYILSYTEEKNNLIFPHLSWAGYLQDWDGPQEGERPAAYLVILGDRSISENYWADPGIAIQSILLAAVEKGYGGCTFGAINKDGLRQELDIDEKFEILYVLALGKPKEKVKLEKMSGNNLEYWRDKKQIHHVPKRALNDLIIK